MQRLTGVSATALAGALRSGAADGGARGLASSAARLADAALGPTEALKAQIADQGLLRGHSYVGGQWIDAPDTMEVRGEVGSVCASPPAACRHRCGRFPSCSSFF